METLAKPLTPENIQSIIDTWKIPSSTPTESGVAILTSFFKKFPNYQAYFKAFKNVPLELLKVRKVFIFIVKNIRIGNIKC